MWQKSKVTTVIVYHDIVLYHTIAFKCKLTDVASFALLLDTFEPHLSRYCPVLILDLISILYTPFCPKGTLPPHQNPPKPSREKGKSIAVMSRKTSRFKRQLLVNQVGSVNFQRYFFPLDGGGGVLIKSINHFHTIEI